MRTMLAYVLIPLATIVTATLGSMFTTNGLGWYRTQSVPSWTPRKSVISGVWTAIFLLATMSALIAWRNVPDSQHFLLGIAFLTNALLNVLWSAVFFTFHQKGLAVFEAVLLALSVVYLIIVLWPYSVWASVLLVPYFLWVCFAILLTFSVWRRNRKS